MEFGEQRAVGGAACAISLVRGTTEAITQKMCWCAVAVSDLECAHESGDESAVLELMNGDGVKTYESMRHGSHCDHRRQLWLGWVIDPLDRGRAAVPSEWCAQWFSRAAMVSAAVALDVLVVWLVCVVGARVEWLRR